MAAENQTEEKTSGPSEQEFKQESSQAAQKGVEYQKKAKELTQAAAGAGDPEERQRLLNEALENELQAGTFGKTAKFLNTGTGQGAAVGAGLGSVPGLTLGSLVTGIVTVITGGVGGAAGSVVGAAHGQWFEGGHVAGDALQSITGNIPGWEATVEQKESLEKMITGVKDTEAPKDDELQALSGGMSGGEGAGQPDGKAQQSTGGEEKQSWSEYAGSYMPSGGTGGESKSGGQSSGSNEGGKEQQSWTESASSYMPSLGSDGKEEQQGDGNGAKEQQPKSHNTKHTSATQTEDKKSTDTHNTLQGSDNNREQPNDEANSQGSKSKKSDKSEEDQGQTTYQGMGGADPQAVDALKERMG